MSFETLPYHDNPEPFRVISWNVNGLRQRHQMNQFLPLFHHNPDIVCIQEAKTTAGRIPRELKTLRGYFCIFNRDPPETMADVMIFSKQEPCRVTYGFGNSEFDNEGRALIAEFETFTLMNMYFPLGLGVADTMGHKLAFYDEFLSCVSRMVPEQKNIIICGDFSIAHTDNDIERQVRRNFPRVGISTEERGKLDMLIQGGFADTLRLFSTSDGHYSWWPNGFTIGERRRGLRLDYFFVNSLVRPYVTGTEILAGIEGSDHCPVMMTMQLPGKAIPIQYSTLEPVYGTGGGQSI